MAGDGAWTLDRTPTRPVRQRETNRCRRAVINGRRPPGRRLQQGRNPPETGSETIGGNRQTGGHQWGEGVAGPDNCSRDAKPHVTAHGRARTGMRLPRDARGRSATQGPLRHGSKARPGGTLEARRGPDRPGGPACHGCLPLGRGHHALDKTLGCRCQQVASQRPALGVPRVRVAGSIWGRERASLVILVPGRTGSQGSSIKSTAPSAALCWPPPVPS